MQNLRLFIFFFIFMYVFIYLVPGILDKVSQPVLVLEYFFQILPWFPELHDLSKKSVMLLFSPQRVHF